MIRSLLRFLRKSGCGATPGAAVRGGVGTGDLSAAAKPGAQQAFTYKKIGADGVTSDHEAGRANVLDIDVWVVPSDAMASLAALKNVLTDAERRYADRITHVHQRTRYIAVRTVLRHALSQRMENAVRSDQWRISLSLLGKPQVSPEQANCSFSITHSDGFSVVAIAPGATVGIDAEKVDRARLKHLPLDCLSENERSRISALAKDRQYFDFFRLWTLKEAYTKALGLGLSKEFDTIEFDLDGASAQSGHPAAADAESYELLTLKYHEFDHLLAICLLGVASGKDSKLAKNLYVVDVGQMNLHTAASKTETISKEKTMPALLHIVDQETPERVELYALEDLPDLLHETFERQALETPHEAALEFNGDRVSYSDLDARANEFANYLIGKGVCAGDRVALYHEMSADLFMCLLGILKAGAVYVPVNPKYSSEHVAAIIAEHSPALIVCSAGLSVGLPAGTADKRVLVDDAKQSLATLTSHGPLFATGDVTAEDDSHVVFKANPAGGYDAITVSHGDAVRFNWSLAAVYGLEAQHRYYQDSTLAFDVALEEALAVLSTGATLVGGCPGAEQSCEGRARFIAEQRITVLSTTPDVLEAFSDEMPTVDVLIVGGRVCPSELAVHWALRTKRVVSLKKPGNRFPCFSIEQENGSAWRPRMLQSHGSERPAA